MIKIWGFSYIFGKKIWGFSYIFEKKIWGFSVFFVFLHQNLICHSNIIMVFKRKIYDKMLKWKSEQDGKTAANV